MNILVVIGDRLCVNSSANLCHLAYINGLLQAGHHVELLAAHDDAAGFDAALQIPEAVVQHTYGVSLYEKLSHLKKHAASEPHAAPASDQTEVHTHGFLSDLKASVRGAYGVYGPSKAWHAKAKQFKSEQYYDCVLSVSCPFISHYTAYSLIKRRHLRYGKWIQIWEDPWYSDIAYASDTEACKKEEEFLCSVAEDIVYVSPITFAYQQKLYPAYADKMRFVPTPSYYDADSAQPCSFSAYTYGYFGDFVPEVRDLKPFYDAAVENGSRAYICGNPTGLFADRNSVCVHPRMDLASLHRIEEKTNVLVFLCNRRGGQIPGKIYQYSMSDKLILFISDGTPEEQKAVENYFSPFGRYVFCKNTKEDIQRAMSEIERGVYADTAKKLTCFEPVRIISQIIG